MTWTGLVVIALVAFCGGCIGALIVSALASKREDDEAIRRVHQRIADDKRDYAAARKDE
jgi:hypothetical protein